MRLCKRGPVFFVATFTLLYVGFGLSRAHAHPAHTSLVEIEVLPPQHGAQVLEVSWDLERQDLELHLAMQSQEHVVLDESTRFHDLLLPWLQNNFLLTPIASQKNGRHLTTSPQAATEPNRTSVKSSAQKSVGSFTFIGKELGATRVLLFFSVVVPVAQKKHLQVPALLYLDENYVNLVNVRRCVAQQTKTQSLHFDKTQLFPQLLLLQCAAEIPSEIPSETSSTTNLNAEVVVGKKAKDRATKTKRSR